MKKFMQVLMMSSLILLSSLTLFAANGGNDGQAKDDPMGDSGAPCRYSNLEYYDVYVPYDLTLKDVGGYATSATSSGKYKFSGTTNWDIKQNCLFNIFNTTTGDLNKSLFDESGYDDNAGGLMYVKKNGVTYYCGAIGQGCYAYSAWNWGLGSNGEMTGADSLYVKGYGAASSGLFFDVILKDGTQIHFCTQSMIGAGHSVGGPETNQDGITYTKASMTYTQYKEMWHCDSPWQMVEVSAKSGSSASSIRSALGISETNPVMYIRIWKGSLAEGSQQVNSGEEAGMTKGSEMSTAGGDGSSAQPSGNSQFASGYYSEEQLSAFTKLVEENIQAEYLDKATRDNLSQNDLENLSSWENNVNNSKKEYGLIAWMRIIVMWIGIIFTIYIFLLYLAYWFDRLNSIIDLDVLSILTFGKLHVAVDEKEANFSLGKKQDRITVSHKDMIFICLTGLIFGTLLITGTFYKIVANFVNFILRHLG